VAIPVYPEAISLPTGVPHAPDQPTTDPNPPPEPERLSVGACLGLGAALVVGAPLLVVVAVLAGLGFLGLGVVMGCRELWLRGLGWLWQGVQAADRLVVAIDRLAQPGCRWATA
jgi:hypothetical protein